MVDDYDEVMESILPYCDCVIYLEEVSDNEERKQEIMETATEWTTHFIQKVNAKLDGCSNDERKIFVKEATTTFLLYALRKMLSEAEHGHKVKIAEYIKDWLVDV